MRCAEQSETIELAARLGTFWIHGTTTQTCRHMHRR
jgi:hypothetical protein